MKAMYYLMDGLFMFLQDYSESSHDSSVFCVWAFHHVYIGSFPSNTEGRTFPLVR